ncbi:MAG TPA: energy-coupling factor transporter transmembrane component T [Candidatus Wallbacteria bacterium]|nr:energy-coupling factor transporter transmembrane component T [Candidatus Wallbacteria bacterium]
MVNDIILGQYMPTGSLVHRASPKIKIISLFLLTFSIFLIKDSYLYFYFLAASVFILKIAGLKTSYLLKGLKPLIFVFVLTFFLNIMFSEGDKILWEWGLVKITEEGLIYSFKFFMKVTLLVIYATLLTLTTSPVELSDGMEDCLKPLKYVKFPVHEFSLMMTIALRFIPTLVMEIDKIKKAQEARGANFSEGNLMGRVKNFIPILIPLFITSFKRADELAVAMESRCYMGGEGRSRYRRKKDGFSDYVMLVMVLSVIFPALVNFFNSLNK